MEERLQEQEVQASLLRYNSENAMNMFSKMSSIISNIIVR
jgi:hypothetical protein